MDLSDDIIYGRNDRVRHLLSTGINVNYIDKYGYTPLIEAAMMDNVEAAKMLVRHGAQIDAVDVAGQTALHWAIDNNNIDLIKFLLAHGASANAYTTDGQPALFNPILRKQADIQQLLLKHGADIHFAKDYINAKLIGHRFELQGYADVVSAEGVFLPIDLEGFFLEYTVSIIQDSLKRFINSYVANRLNLHTKELARIVEAMDDAAKLRSFKHFKSSVDENIPVIKDLIAKDLLLLPVSYAGHAITFTKHGDFFAKCDRGVSRMQDPIVIHHVQRQKQLQLPFYKDLLYEKQTEFNMKQGIYQTLGLKPYIKLPIKHQVSGNCSWANVEASVPVMLFMLLKDSAQDRNQLREIVRDVMKFYVVWKEWDKDRAIEDCIRDFEQMNPNRRKAKAALLGSVFFQACDYRRKKDVQRAQRIAKILTQQSYQYVMRSYIKVFMNSGKGGTPAKLLHRLLQTLDLSPKDFGM